MRKLTYLTLIAFIAISCNNKQTNDKYNIKEYTDNYGDFLKNYEEPTQTFSAPAEKPSDVTGAKGTVIKVDPNALETVEGSPLGNTIDIELKELKSKGDLLRSNLPTVSNGQILVSDGAFYLNMTSDGKQLKIKDEKSLIIEFPSDAKESMELFYGKRDENGQFNWEQANQNLETEKEYETTTQPSQNQTSSKSDFEALFDYIESDTTSSEPISKEEARKLKRVFYPLELHKFGWINCDRFWEDERPKTDILVKTNPEDTLEWISVHLLFKDINSMMQCQYTKDTKYEWANKFNKVPVGQQVQLLAVTYSGGKIFVYQKDLTVKGNQTVTLAMAEVNEDEFEQIMKKIK